MVDLECRYIRPRMIDCLRSELIDGTNLKIKDKSNPCPDQLTQFVAGHALLRRMFPESEHHIKKVLYDPVPMTDLRTGKSRSGKEADLSATVATYQLGYLRLYGIRGASEPLGFKVVDFSKQKESRATTDAALAAIDRNPEADLRTTGPRSVSVEQDAAHIQAIFGKLKDVFPNRFLVSQTPNHFVRVTLPYSQHPFPVPLGERVVGVVGLEFRPIVSQHGEPSDLIHGDIAFLYPPVFRIETPKKAINSI